MQCVTWYSGRYLFNYQQPVERLLLELQPSPRAAPKSLFQRVGLEKSVEVNLRIGP